MKTKVTVTTGSRWNKCDWTLLVQKLPELAEQNQDDSLDVALVSAYLDDEHNLTGEDQSDSHDWFPVEQM